MKVISDYTIDILLENFFKESHFLRTKHKVSDWFELSRRIQAREIQSHFKGNYYVGAINRQNNVNWFKIDLDSHSKTADSTLRKRKDTIIERIGYSPHIIGLTPHKGLVMLYLLDRQYPISEISYVIGSLFNLKRGYIELFPNNNGIRLFGGKDCPLLGQNLQIIADSTKEIEKQFIGVWENSPRLVLNEISQYTKQRTTHNNKRLIQKAEQLFNIGLTESNSRNDALLILSRYFQGIQGLTPEQTAKKLKNWIRLKHNGFSNDWKYKPNKVEKHIDDLVEYFKPSKFNKKSLKITFPLENLKEETLEAIQNLAIKISANTGIKCQKIIAFLEDLISYCRKKHIDGEVEIPMVIFQSCRNGSGNRYTLLKKELEKLEVLKLKVNYCTNTHKCRKYKILDELII